MAVRIPGPDDINASPARNQRGVVNVQADPIGQVFENLGDTGRQIASHLHDQQTEGDVLRADLAARQELDVLRRKIEAGQDPTQYEAQFQQGAATILQARGQGMSRDAQALWERRSAELLTDGIINTREGAQRRMLSDATASVRRTQEEADRIIQDPESDDATRDQALATLRIAASKARERGFLSPDAEAQFVTATEGRLAEVRRTIGLTASAQQATDAIFTEYDGLDERLAAARAITNPALRDRVEDEVVQRQARDNAARGELLDQAYTHIAAGERVPQALFNQLSGRDQVTLQDYIRERSRAIAAGAEIPRDRARISDLTVMAADRSRRREFLAVDLQSERGRLGEAAYSALRIEQDRQRNGGERDGASEETLSSALRVGRMRLRAAGYPLNADGQLSAEATPEAADQMIEFQADLVGLLDRFVDENDGRQPNAQEQLSAVQNLLASRGTVREGWFGSRDLNATDTYTPYTSIPQADRERIATILREEGQAVTRGNVERLYEMQTTRRLRSGN